jgi:glycerol-3-phosphate acyltransferase PlsX
MGSDAHPAPDVEGAVQAAAEYGDTIILVGDQTGLKAELAKHDTTGHSIEIVHASQAISMEDSPAKVARGKPDSSIHVGLDLVERGEAQAFVSCGNTGAILAIATLHKLKRIPGVHRPTLSSIVPFGGHPIVLLDLGANVDCKAEWLVQFALMGSIYAEKALGVQTPRVALLSNGEEEGKGNSLVHETAPLLAASPLNYIGNIEPKELTRGAADVVVCDGFAGNLVTKTLEAMGMLVFSEIKAAVMENLRSKIGAALLKPAFRSIYRKLDPFEIGGAPLLGLNGVVIIGHGRSNALAVKNAIRQARQAIAGNIVEAIREGLAAQNGAAT